MRRRLRLKGPLPPPMLGMQSSTTADPESLPPVEPAQSLLATLKDKAVDVVYE